jgi:hypothetical protein
MDPDGFGIVLWGSFWPIVSRVCVGEPIEEAIAAHFEQTQQRRASEGRETDRQTGSDAATTTRRSPEK